MSDWWNFLTSLCVEYRRWRGSRFIKLKSIGMLTMSNEGHLIYARSDLIFSIPRVGYFRELNELYFFSNFQVPTLVTVFYHNTVFFFFCFRFIFRTKRGNYVWSRLLLLFWCQENIRLLLYHADYRLLCSSVHLRRRSVSQFDWFSALSPEFLTIRNDCALV